VTWPCCRWWLCPSRHFSPLLVTQGGGEGEIQSANQYGSPETQPLARRVGWGLHLAFLKSVLAKLYLEIYTTFFILILRKNTDTSQFLTKNIKHVCKEKNVRKIRFRFKNGSSETFLTLFLLVINNVNNNAISRVKMRYMRGISDLSKELEPAIHRGLNYFRDPKAETVLNC
jgi:hypothetical protein